MWVLTLCTGLSMGLEMRVSYQDNVFHYSYVDIEEFKTGVNLYRYPIEAIDDIVASYKLSFKLRRYIFDGKRTTFNLHVIQHQFVLNRRKSYNVLYFNIWQKLYNSIFIQPAIRYTPVYLIRWMRNRRGEYVPCEYETLSLQLRMGYSVPKYKVAVWVTYKYDDYCEDFDYYDTRIWCAGISIYLREIKAIHPTISYSIVSAYAAGKLPDISHRDSRICVNLAPQLGRLKFNLSYIGIKRNYTTELDITHRDRSDIEHRVAIELWYRVTADIHIGVGYTLRKRYAYSPYVLNIDEEKDFTLNIVTIGLNVRYR